MRTPTTREEAYRWWTAATTGGHAPRHDGHINAGFFKMRKWSRGPWIPARIWIEKAPVDPVTGELLQDETFAAEIDGQPATAERVWRWAHPVTLSEWTWLTAQSPLLPSKPPPPKPGPFAHR